VQLNRLEMKTFTIKTETGPIFREQAESFNKLISKIETWPAAAVPGLLGPAYRNNGIDWYATVCAMDHYGKPTAFHREVWIRIDGLGKVECNPSNPKS
jgi:hypothetical protein